jgi:hypothetical protein
VACLASARRLAGPYYRRFPARRAALGRALAAACLAAARHPDPEIALRRLLPELLAGVAAAPEGRLDDQARELAARFWPLARKLTRPARARNPWLWEEIDSEAGIELVRLVGRLEPGREGSLPGLIRTRILGACSDVLRRETRRRFAPLPDDLEARA